MAHRKSGGVGQHLSGGFSLVVSNNIYLFLGLVNYISLCLSKLEQ